MKVPEGHTLLLSNHDESSAEESLNDDIGSYMNDRNCNNDALFRNK